MPGETKTTAIVSAAPGCGATHLAVALGSFFKGVLRKSVTIGEANGQRTLEQLEQCYQGGRGFGEEEKNFTILGVRYAKQVPAQEIAELFWAGPDELLLDFGVCYEEYRREILRCQRCFIMISFREWKIASMLDFLERTKMEPGREKWIYLTRDGYKADIREIEKSYHIKVRTVPWEEDPFHIKRENLAFYETLTGGK